MIFTFPAIVSENVDQRLLPGITKSLEQYYLQHMVSALSTGSIRPYIDVDSTGHASSIRMESLDYFDDLQYLQETRKKKPRDTTVQTNQGYGYGENDYENLNLSPEAKTHNALKQAEANLRNREIDLQNEKLGRQRDKEEYERNRATNINFNPTINVPSQGHQPSPDQEERDRLELQKTRLGINKTELELQKADQELNRAGIGVNPKVDLKTPPGLGFVPTMTAVETNIWIRSPGLGITKFQLQQRSIIIGVKIIPIVARNFNSMYQVLRDDYYANTIRYLFKGASRAIIRTLYSNAITRKFRRWYELALGRSAPDEIGSSPLDWYFSILLSPKALLNAGGFKPESGGLTYRQFTSAIAIMNKDEKEDLFENPSRLQRLFNMGWNSFLICDDRKKQATFCSNLDRGRCTMLPYSFIMTSIHGENIYKSYEDLEKASGGFFRHMKTSSLNIQKVIRESFVDSIYKKYSITESKKKVNEGIVIKGADIVEHGGKAIIDNLLEILNKYVKSDDLNKLHGWIKEKVPKYGTITIISILCGYIATVIYKNKYSIYVEKCSGSDIPTFEGKKLCILKAKIDANKQTIMLLNSAKTNCSKLKDKKGSCEKHFNDRIHKIKKKIYDLQYKMARG